MCALLWKAHAQVDVLPSSASSHREQAHHRVNLIATRYSKEQSNLAMARYKLMQIERALTV